MKRFTLSAAAVWLATAAPTVLAWQQTWHPDEHYSLGLKQPISSDGWQIPGFTVLGVSQILRDRIIMTPPHPGGMRAAIWTDHANPYKEWTVEIEFRATGDERSGGSFGFWYTSGGAGYQGTDSVYTARPWDGLAILVDKDGPHGGSVRGFLNDGKTDYSIHHNVPSLAFGHCDFSYRNQGAPSTLKITNTRYELKVEAGGRTCFETKEVRLSHSSFFGVTAASADSPDSFELFKFILTSPAVGHPELLKKKEEEKNMLKPDPVVKRAQENKKEAAGHEKLPHEKDFEEFKDDVPDKPASVYKTQEEQFADLHDRLTSLNHHLHSVDNFINGVYDKVDVINHRIDDFREEFRHTRVPREQIDRMEGRLSAVESMIRELETVLISKDYSKHLDKIQLSLKDQHEKHGKLAMGVWIGLFCQVMLFGGYVWYKRRKSAMPKKYL